MSPLAWPYHCPGPAQTRKETWNICPKIQNWSQSCSWWRKTQDKHLLKRISQCSIACHRLTLGLTLYKMKNISSTLQSRKWSFRRWGKSLPAKASPRTLWHRVRWKPDLAAGRSGRWGRYGFPGILPSQSGLLGPLPIVCFQGKATRWRNINKDLYPSNVKFRPFSSSFKQFPNELSNLSPLRHNFW